MKHYHTLLLFISSIFVINTISAQNKFDTYFKDKTLRIDYNLAGNHKETRVYPIQLKEEPYWGGSLTNLIDTFQYGDFNVLVEDKETQKLIYSRGFSNLFIEWQDTPEAKTQYRSFYESLIIPYPKMPVIVKIQKRDYNNSFNTIFSLEVNPESIHIKKDKQLQFKTKKIHYSGNHHEKLDIVIIPDGYTQAEADKFINDCKRFVGYFFEVEPFKSNKDKVNFHAVEAWSEESGTDIPSENIWKNTILSTHFSTFGYERYLTTQETNTLRNLAAYAPYDQIYILVNTSKYGGGGVYNYYNLCSADHEASGRVFTHEFGHAFAALADEYEYGFENAADIYNLEIEPWQVNITTLKNFSSKWKNMVDKKTPIPTPVKRRYKNKVGAFEGAGYVEKQVYRPTYDCKMRTNNTDEFCPVCYKAVLDLLLFYAK